jgi:catechol 2,3-dioxygenase-like lactoylglutathione lyase family enzyme
MSLRVGSTVLNAYDVRRAAAFWCAALGYAPRGDGDDRFTVLVGDGPSVSLQRSLQRPPDRPHVHLDLYTEDQAAEVDRLLGLGATKVPWDYPPDPDFVVLQDPEGNRFCVIAA